jgi:hypothetical protein
MARKNRDLAISSLIDDNTPCTWTVNDDGIIIVTTCAPVASQQAALDSQWTTAASPSPASVSPSPARRQPSANSGQPMANSGQPAANSPASPKWRGFGENVISLFTDR